MQPLLDAIADRAAFQILTGAFQSRADTRAGRAAWWSTYAPNKVRFREAAAAYWAR